MELRDEGVVSAIYHLTLTEAEARALEFYLRWAPSSLVDAMEKEVVGNQAQSYRRDMVRLLTDFRHVLPSLLVRADKAREAFKADRALAPQQQDPTEGGSAWTRPIEAP